MNKKVLLSLMICGAVCLSLIGTSFAQTPVVTNTESKPAADGKLEPKKSHAHKKKTGTKAHATKGKAKKHKKAAADSAADQTTKPQTNSVTN